LNEVSPDWAVPSWGFSSGGGDAICGVLMVFMIVGEGG
jgi:hypothetical protein